MKPNANSGRSANYALTPFTVTKAGAAKVVPHPLSKKPEDSHTSPPDEETLLRLNAMAKQYPFCIRHRGNNKLL
jgi:hypothetical protein